MHVFLSNKAKARYFTCQAIAYTFLLVSNCFFFFFFGFYESGQMILAPTKYETKP